MIVCPCNRVNDKAIAAAIAAGADTPARIFKACAVDPRPDKTYGCHICFPHMREEIAGSKVIPIKLVNSAG